MISLCYLLARTREPATAPHLRTPTDPAPSERKRNKILLFFFYFSPSFSFRHPKCHCHRNKETTTTTKQQQMRINEPFSSSPVARRPCFVSMRLCDIVFIQTIVCYLGWNSCYSCVRWTKISYMPLGRAHRIPSCILLGWTKIIYHSHCMAPWPYQTQHHIWVPSNVHDGHRRAPIRRLVSKHIRTRPCVCVLASVQMTKTTPSIPYRWNIIFAHPLHPKSSVILFTLIDWCTRLPWLNYFSLYPNAFCVCGSAECYFIGFGNWLVGPLSSLSITYLWA